MLECLKYSILIVSSIAAFSVYSRALAAPPDCWDTYEEMVIELSSQPKEQYKIFEGGTSRHRQSNVITSELWVNTDTGEYTNIVILSNGGVCIAEDGANLSFGPFEDILSLGDTT